MAQRLPACGTIARYRKSCRCSKCRAANAAYQRAYQARLREQGVKNRYIVQVDSKLHARIKKRCQKEAISMRAFVDEALKRSLRSR